MKELKKLQPFLRVSLWLYMALILFLMIMPTKGGVVYDFPMRDKVIHFALFSFLGLIYVISDQPLKKNIWNLKNWKLYLLLLFAFLVEGIHYFIEYRTFEIADSLANGLGFIFGIFLWRVVLIRFLGSDN